MTARRTGPLRVAIAAACLAGAGACSLTPRHDREWYPYLANLPHVEQTGTEVAITPVSDWSYEAAGPTDQCYTDARFDINTLNDVWFVLEPQPGSTRVAHTFLLFEFEDDQLEGLTIEARREADENYSAVRGAFRAYELYYLWGSARDLLTRRAVYLDHEVFIYPLALTDAQKRYLLANLVARTAEIEAQPRFYNTFFSNCTNELAKAVDLDWHYAFVLTGLSDEYLYRRGFIPGATFADAHARSDMTAFIKALNEDGLEVDFDAAVLAELRRRRDAEETPLVD